MRREIPNYRQLQRTTLIRLLSSSLLVVSIGLSGCAAFHQRGPGNTGDATVTPVKSAASLSDQRVVIPVPEKIPTVKAYQHEIVRLKWLLAEKDKLIQSQATIGLNPVQTQGQTLLKPASGVSQAKSQQYRLATKPEAASKIAEVEVSLTMLKASVAAKHNPELLSLAQSFLDAALLAYEYEDFSSAMSYAAQSQEGIEMIAGLTEKSYEQQPQQPAPVILRTPLLLQTRYNESLKIAPNDHAETQSILAPNTAVTATAYHEHWLRIETRDGRSGWIPSQSIDARINLPILSGQENEN